MDDLVYLGLGSNMGDSQTAIQQALSAVSKIPDARMLRTSSLYQTSPVSPLAQRDFINCACALSTTLSPETLYRALHTIELSLGKISKEKNAPRPIDIDILFFGSYFLRTATLNIPHPHWQERLFVLVPLLELTTEILVPFNEHEECEKINLPNLLQAFSNPHQERVTRLRGCCT